MQEHRPGVTPHLEIEGGREAWAGVLWRPVWSGLVKKLPLWPSYHLPSGWRGLEYGGFLVRDPRVMGKNELCGVDGGAGRGEGAGPLSPL